jgi:broad specificity phosphatase PhoE
MIKLQLFRHGETDWNKLRLTQGQSDIPLNMTGVAQAFELSRALEDEKFDLILSSDLARANQTAKYALIKHDPNIPMILSENLRETNFGNYEGKHCDLFIEQCKHIIESWNSLDNNSYDAKCKGVESQREVINRFLHCIEDSINQYPNSRNVAIFTHGGLMKNLYKYVAGEIKMFKNGESLTLYYSPETGKLSKNNTK